MSARIPIRRLGQSALASSRQNTYWISTSRRSLSSTPSLSASEDPNNNNTPAKSNLSNDILYKLLQERQRSRESSKKGKTNVGAPAPEEATLSPTSIFAPENEIPGFSSDLTPQEISLVKKQEKDRRTQAKLAHEAALSSAKLDPHPRSRKLLQRKLVIKGVRRRGRLTKDLQLARTERQSLFRSKDLPTSVKKLTRIMHLIQGKTVEEALVQLRFSKKRVAQDVRKGLMMARDEAVAARGMGLGAAKSKELADGTKIEGEKKDGVKIELKDGKRKVVNDPTEIYIDQAWVGKGLQWKSPEFRARGKINMLTHRTTSFSVLLKEEKTRMRISEEIAKKRDNRKLWVPLPDRPVTSQRQYCMW